MIDNITKQAFSEVNDIIEHLEDDLYNKIPNSFIKMIKKNMDMRIQS